MRIRRACVTAAAGGLQRADLLVSSYHVLPSLADLLSLASRLPRTPPLPGRNFAETLAGRPQERDQMVFFQFGHGHSGGTQPVDSNALHPEILIRLVDGTTKRKETPSR